MQGQQKFLSGYGGAKTTNLERLAEARKPRHIALSLMGEPTLYPYLKELIDLISKKGMTSFLVSNATHPEVLADLEPTQLYLSLNAPMSYSTDAYAIRLETSGPKSKKVWT